MAQAALVDQMILDGARALKALDGAGIEASAALWLLDDETARWSLVIATPLIDRVGTRETYGRLQAAFSGMAPPLGFPLWEIDVRSPSDPLIAALRASIRVDPGQGTVRISRSTFNGVFIEDAFVYRSG